jgi:hypothetical protein
VRRSTGNDLLTMTLAALAVAVCCGFPLAIALVVTTGLGAVLLAQGWLLLGLLLLAVGLGLGVRYLMRARIRATRGWTASTARATDNREVRAEPHE